MGLPPVNRRWGSLFIEEVGVGRHCRVYGIRIHELRRSDKRPAPGRHFPWRGQQYNMVMLIGKLMAWRDTGPV